MKTKEQRNRTPIEELHDTRVWPKDLPMPKAGAYSRYKKWTVEEEDLVRELYYTYGPIYLARLLGRSKDAVRAHAGLIGVVKPRIWSAREIETLKREYGKHGRKSNRIIAGLLGRSNRAIEHKARELGLSLATPSKKWSKRELKLLHDHFGTMPIDELARKIGRTRNAVTMRASIQGLTTPQLTLTPRQRKFIADNLGKISIKKMAKRLGVSASRVMTEADRLGYRPHKGREVWSRGTPPPPPERPHHRRPWTAEEDALIAEHYSLRGGHYTADLLGRSRQATARRAWRLGISASEFVRQWTAEEDALIAQHYPLRGSRYTADLLGRSRQATTERARRLGISASEFVRRWTAEEDALIAQHYPLRGVRYTADLLGRSQEATVRRARHLGISVKVFAGRWTQEEDALLRKLYGTRKVAEIAREMNRTTNSIAVRISRLGLAADRNQTPDSEE